MDYKELLIEMGYKITSEGGHYYSLRPKYRESDNDNALLVYKNTGVCKDFVEDRNFSFQTLVSETLGISYKDAKQWIEGKGGNFEAQQKEEIPKIKVPRKFSMDDLGYTSPSYEFYLKRGISQKTLEEFKCVLSHGGKFSNRIVFPQFCSKTNKILSFAGRDALNNPRYTRKKWKLLGPASTTCYPAFISQPHIIETEQVVLVESIGDALALWDAGVRQILVLFGLNMSKELLCYVTSLNPKIVFIGLNNDELKEENRGQNAANKVREKLLKFFSPKSIKNLILPNGDFGEMGKKEIIDFANENGIKLYV